jgi:CUB/sushi domain-containing protein
MVSAPINGAISDVAILSTGQSAIFTCNDGFSLRDDSRGEVSCVGVPTEQVPQLDDGSARWCDVNHCAGNVLPPTPDGTVTQSGIASSGGTVELSCPSGFDLQGGDSTAACRVVAGKHIPEWDDASQRTCVAVLCNAYLTEPDHGSVAPIWGKTGDTAVFRCDDGYEFESNAAATETSTTCMPDSTWSVSTEMIVCVAKQCSLVLQEPVNGGVLPSVGGSTSDKRVFTCDIGYTLSGPSTTECLENGMWSLDTPPTCTATPCFPTLVSPENGSVSNISGTYQSVITFTCDDGFSLQGSETTTCTAASSWSHNPPQCIPVQCTPPMTRPDRGFVSDSGSASTGGQVDFECASELAVLSGGAAKVLCTAGSGPFAEWDDNAPRICTGITKRVIFTSSQKKHPTHKNAYI